MIASLQFAVQGTTIMEYVFVAITNTGFVLGVFREESAAAFAVRQFVVQTNQPARVSQEPLIG